MAKTVVAVAPSLYDYEDGPRLGLNIAYSEAIQRAGMIPLIVAPREDISLAGDALANVAGLILTGGVDVDPALYAQQPHPATEAPSVTRDRWELALFDMARTRGMPVLAICRGMQLVNVALGGTLVQDIASERKGSLSHERSECRTTRVHGIDVQSGSRLDGLLRRSPGVAITVNSMHHQAIAELAPDLVVTASAPDGIIEAVEWPNSAWWMLGVQWHPEELIGDAEPWDRNIFAEFNAVVGSR